MEALFFRAHTSDYLAPLASLAEVLMPAELRPVPKAPAFLCGFLQLRGAAMPVLDLRERLQLPPRQGFQRGNRILRLCVGGHDLGIIVDAVLRIAVLQPTQRRARVLAVGDAQGLLGPLWEVNGSLVQELALAAVLSGDELSALAWEQDADPADDDSSRLAKLAADGDDAS